MKRTKQKNRLAAVRKLGTAAIAGVQAARDSAATRIDEARAKAMGTVNQLERAFETRLTRAMSRLGVPSSREVRALAREVATLKCIQRDVRLLDSHGAHIEGGTSATGACRAGLREAVNPRVIFAGAAAMD